MEMQLYGDGLKLSNQQTHERVRGEKRCNAPTVCFCGLSCLFLKFIISHHQVNPIENAIEVKRDHGSRGPGK